MTQRTKTIRVPLIVDEKGNTFVQAWAHADTEPEGEDTEAMIEQARELHAMSHPSSQTVVVRWATIQLPLPESEGEVPGTIQASRYYGYGESIRIYFTCSKGSLVAIHVDPRKRQTQLKPGDRQKLKRALSDGQKYIEKRAASAAKAAPGKPKKKARRSKRRRGK